MAKRTEHAMVEEALILKTPRDEVLKKLRHLQDNKLTAKQLEQLELQNKYLKIKKEKFVLFFKKLAYKRFGLKINDFNVFNKEELETLAEEIFRQNTPRVILQYFCLTLLWIPIIGWIAAGATYCNASNNAVNNDGMLGRDQTPFWSKRYNHYYRILKNSYGKDWFPYDLVKEHGNG